MALSIKPEHPDITEQMWVDIDKIIADHCNTPGAVITVLRMIQDVVGYLPLELIDYIGYGLNLPRSNVYAVASFYSLFSFVPKGRHVIKICMGTACYVKGIKGGYGSDQLYFQCCGRRNFRGPTIFSGISAMSWGLRFGPCNGHRT
jgi:NADH:ubiquinone oxidoreductase subunit E